jgi:hypothetical protein
LDHPFWWSRDQVTAVWTIESESVQIWTEKSVCVSWLWYAELTWYVYKWIVDNSTNFLKSLGSPELDAWDSSYGFLKWVLEFCPNLDRIYV